MKTSVGSIIALILSCIFAVAAVNNGYKFYCSNFFEWIVIFFITSLITYICFLIACFIRNTLGNVFIVSDSLTGIFYKKLFLQFCIHCIALIIGGYLGSSIAYTILGYYDSYYKGDYSEKILERRDAAGKKFYLNAKNERDKRKPLSEEQYYNIRSERNPNKIYKSKIWEEKQKEKIEIKKKKEDSKIEYSKALEKAKNSLNEELNILPGIYVRKNSNELISAILIYDIDFNNIKLAMWNFPQDQSKIRNAYDLTWCDYRYDQINKEKLDDNILENAVYYFSSSSQIRLFFSNDFKKVYVREYNNIYKLEKITNFEVTNHKINNALRIQEDSFQIKYNDIIYKFGLSSDTDSNISKYINKIINNQ